MIYPPQFPTNNDNEYEREVYLALSKLMDTVKPENDDYDVFCFRKFSGIVKSEKIEYELDFIIADLRNGKLNGVLVIEVKGHTLKFNGTTSRWIQDSREMKSSPTIQATQNMRSLLERFNFLQQNVPFGWAIWFPKMINPGKDYLPTELSEAQYFDQNSLIYAKEKLETYFETLYMQWSHKTGTSLDVYHQLKEPLIRNLGYALPLHKKIEAAEVRFLEMTNRQLDLLRIIGNNKDILITGPAGSGKTIMATTIARELADTGEKVLILTFSRILANNIRYGMGKPENPEVTTYHSLARRYIDLVDPEWWTTNSKEDNFWDLEVPAKLEEALSIVPPVYDSIIIDEAQDLQELWFENLNKLVKRDGGYFVFMDEDQDVNLQPNLDSFKTIGR